MALGVQLLFMPVGQLEANQAALANLVVEEHHHHHVLKEVGLKLGDRC
jgi:hypothetical protein